MGNLELALVLACVLVLISILASKASGRSGVPALLLFLAIGMVAGSEGLGGIYFDNAELARSIGVVALALILFSGGLDTRVSSIRPVLGRGIVLATLGTLVTAGLVGALVALITDLPLLEALLLGAVVSSTDAAAVFAVLRARKIHLPSSVRSLLELESGTNDPMAVFLTVSLIELITSRSRRPASRVRPRWCSSSGTTATSWPRAVPACAGRTSCSCSATRTRCARSTRRASSKGSPGPSRCARPTAPESVSTTTIDLVLTSLTGGIE